MGLGKSKMIESSSSSDDLDTDVVDSFKHDICKHVMSINIANKRLNHLILDYLDLSEYNLSTILQIAITNDDIAMVDTIIQRLYDKYENIDLDIVYPTILSYDRQTSERSDFMRIIQNIYDVTRHWSIIACAKK